MADSCSHILRAAARLLALAACCLPALSGSALAQAAEEERPNIVVIMTDDQRVDDLYAEMGGGRLMPRTRELIGDAGVTFDRSYVSYSLSCPSRSTFLTGRYAHNHGITANVLPGEENLICGKHGLFPVADSLGPWLQGVGYFTIIAGRYLNGYPAPISTSRTSRDPGWNRWYVPVTVGQEEAADFYEYFLNENGRVIPPSTEALYEDSIYFTDVIVDRAATAIEEAPEDQPVFLFLSHRAPHEDVKDPEGPEPARRHAMFTELLERPLLPSYDEADISDKPAFFRQQQERLSFGEERQIGLRARRRLASLRAVDEGTAEIVEALRRSGRLENSYLFFTSDNGFLLGEHRLPKGKIRPYEESTRVPLMVSGPGIPRGEISRELVSNVDLAATVLRLAGAHATTPLDGRSLLHFLRRPEATSDRPLLLHSFRDDSAEAVGANPRVQAATFKAIVLGRFKLVVYDRGGAELYDLARDPFELDNRYDDPAYARTRGYLADQLERLKDCVGAACSRGVPPPPEPS